MAIINASQGINNTLNSFGLGTSTWDLGQGSYELDGDTLTFLDITSAISPMLDGLGLGLGTIPTAEQVLRYLKSKNNVDNPQDGMGRTYLLNDTVKFSNNILEYQQPDNSSVLMSWGTKTTDIGVVVMLTGSDYISKTKYLTAMLSKNTGLTGGRLNHPIYGTLEKTFVKDFSIASSNELFNGSIISISFSTAKTYTLKEVEVSTARKILGWVRSAANIIQVISSLPNLPIQIKTLLSNPFFSLTGSTLTFSGGTVLGSYVNSSGKTVGVKERISDQSVVSSVEKMQAEGIPLDYSIEDEYNNLMQICCTTMGITVANFGTGETLKTTTIEYTVTSLLDTKYLESTVDSRGNRIVITREVTSSNSVFFTIKETINTYYLTVTNYSLTYLKNLIDNFIVACSAYAEIYSDQYVNYAQLIATVQNTYWLVRDFKGDKTVLEDDISIFSLTDDPETLIKDNPNLAGCRPLRNGMTVYV